MLRNCTRSCLLAFLVVAGALLATSGSAFADPPANGDTPQKWISGALPDLIELYQSLHRNPEVSLAEKETAARVAAQLRAAGAEVTEGVGGHGVVGILKNGPGPIILVRTDLDALPVTEATGLPYASQVRIQDAAGGSTGVMHACGHDVHMTCLIGTARYLATHRDQWKGTIMFIGQPAEERGSGARLMLADQLFERFGKPAFALALHCDSSLATEKLGYRAGFILANVDSVDITIRGRGGHGAYPHSTIDPIVIAARLILDLQTIVSREIEPTQPAVVTVGSIRAGQKHNIIPDTCQLQLTLRSYTDEVRAQLLAAVTRKARAAAASAGAPEPTVERSEGTPATYNDPALVERVLPSLRKVVGDENLVLSELSMGGEDFSEFGRAGVPIFMYRLGTISPERIAKYTADGGQLPSLHSAAFFADAEPAVRVGVVSMATAVIDLLRSTQ